MHSPPACSTELSSVVRVTWMAAGNMVNIRGSERGRGDDLTRLLRTSRAKPFRPDLSSDALRMERSGGTSLPCSGAAHSGLAESTLKMSFFTYWFRQTGHGVQVTSSV